MDWTEIKDAPGKGKGVFARQTLSPMTDVFELTDYTVSAISNSQLSDFCYHCYAGSRYDGDTWYSIGQYRDADLKICSGCTVARFCGRQCQTQAWKKYHKYECKVFAKLPGVLPESVRAAIRFALQHANGLLLQGAWPAVLTLTSHLDDLEKAGGDDWMNLILMAKAATEYSKAADETTFLKLFCIIKTNAITLLTTFNDPIGLCLDPFLATLNHSCDPNIALHRPTYTNMVGWPQRKQSGCVMAKILPLREIAKGEELFISYIDWQEHVSKRQSKLQKNYFFLCACPVCSRELQLEKDSVKDIDPGAVASEAALRARAEKQFEILTSPSSTKEALETAARNLSNIAEALESSSSFSLAVDPYNKVLQELKLFYMTDRQSFHLALINTLKQHLVVGPQIYASPINPTRVVNAIYLLQILALLDDQQEPSHHSGQNSVHQRNEIEKHGLSRTSLKYWRTRICMEMREPLNKSIAIDLAECFEKEQIMIGLSIEDAQRLMGDFAMKRAAEEEVRQLLGISGGRWTDVKSSWARMTSGASQDL